MVPKVSIVIPVYNAAPHLRRCLNAVCGQTLRDIEIICANDGSTDDSGEILREYAARDGRIKLIMLPVNMGAATARNRGMEAARGEYLSFVDSDDHPYPDFYEKLYMVAKEKDADAAKGNYRYWDLNGRSLPVDYSQNDRIREHRTNFSFAFCSAIYRRTMLASHDVAFPEDLIDIEDPIFTLKAALVCNGVAIVDDAEINIMIHKDSATFGAPSISRIFAKFEGLTRIIAILNQCETLAEESYAFVAAFWIRSVFETSQQNKTEQAYKIIVSGLYDVFRSIRLRERCAAELAAFGLAGLSVALASGKITKLAACVMRSYDERTFTAGYLRLLSQKKRKMQAGQATVAIPVYVERPNAMEMASLQQCLSVLGGHRIAFFGPESLDVSVYEGLAREHGIVCGVERFPDIYFKSPLSYSTLLLDADFYGRFIHSEYLLVYQLDSWVFRAELTSWCAKGYDYIGAPWFEGYSEAGNDSAFVNPSGNGGFSLRNVWAFIECLNALRIAMTADKIETDDFDEAFNLGHEDTILVRSFPKAVPGFAIAPIGESMRFSFEALPERLYALIGALPFGCHAFARYNPEFWRQYIQLEPTDLGGLSRTSHEECRNDLDF